MIVNISDLKCPEDQHGRTYKEINRAERHALAVGQIVGIKDSGVRLLVKKLTRDCDETPLYSIGFDDHICHGYHIDDLTLIDNK